MKRSPEHQESIKSAFAALAVLLLIICLISGVSTGMIISNEINSPPGKAWSDLLPILRTYVDLIEPLINSIENFSQSNIAK